MTSNFDFVNSHFPELYKSASQAEKMVYVAPRGSCFYARFTLETAVIWLYDNDPYLKLPYDKNNLGALIHEQTFKDNLKPGLFPKIRLIHKMGNLAAHDSSPVSAKDALNLVKELFHFLYWLCRYYSPDGRNLPDFKFDRAIVPHPEKRQDLSIEKLQELEKQLSQADEMRRIVEEREKQTDRELQTLKAQIKALKEQNEAVFDRHNYNENEADTRRNYIDVLLKETGWNIHREDWTEYEVEGMPTETGKGRIDYVLWGDDGKPLAVIEAKRTSISPQAGKHQAKLYADCLESKFSQRPVIFYSNGFETWIWDDRNYPPRQIQGFLKKDELERIIFRRTHRKGLHLVQINSDIVNRSYQKEAIRQITATFDPQNGRKALLVMATGTGKTRTAIALVDLLMRANWVKRVLFLADRTALLTQALRAFKTHLPTATAIDLTKNANADNANVVLSTYPTMFNRINNSDGDRRLFGCGHFDLVIVDEAHRSIYKKYRLLFKYFDALLVGLTATPRSEVNRDTYRIFELEPGVPTFAYELDDAIKDGFLVPPTGIDVPFKFLRRGIRYADLSPEEREEYEERFQDEETGEIPDRVDAAALNSWLFNINTVDRALEILMEKGLKVEGGDRLGKTIIFARNHRHAEFIVERFDVNYPHYKGHFAQIIDSHDNYAQNLLDRFTEADKDPAIAVSVDMLDTGVDVPEVVNLVFFKPVYSRVKFNQMIGRGTRLCRDLFGVSKDKTEFLIFDLCSNFDYFSQEIPEADPKLPDSLTARLVKARLGLIKLIPTEDPIIENRDLRRSLLDDLHQHVTSMERNNFLVRPHLQQVEEFSQRDRWESLSDPDITTISDTLAPLPNGLPRENRLVKEFDLLCLKLQLSILQQSPDFVTLRDRVRDISHSLEAKRDIPMVKAQLTLIEEVQVESWWEDATLESIEYIRKNLRELVKFIDRQQQNIIYTDFIDELGEITDVNVPIQQTGFSPYQYRKKVETYIRNNENHVAIAKLKRNLPLTEADLDSLETMLFAAEEIESRDRFEQVFGKDLSLKIFIRKLVGLDRQAAKQAFSQYLEGNNYTGNQIRFIETIIDYLTQNGIIDPKLLYEPPFTDLHYEGLDGVFDDSDADNIFSIVCSFNRPRIPNYRKKRGLYQVTFPAQAVSYDEYESTCKLAISRECKPELINKEIVIPGGSSFSSEQLAEVRIVPSCGKLWVEYVYKSEIETAKGLDFRHALGIDPGVSNWLTAVSTKGRSFIVCGRKIKSINQRYNKAVAKYKKGKSDFYWDERLDEITHKRNCQIRDSVNKAARFIINYCLNHDIGNIVFGWGQRIKTSSNLGKRNNQNFIQIPTARLKNRIKELAESLGIIFTETEESYTSKSSFLDGDLLPKYGEKADATEPSSHGGSQAHQAPSQYEFSGKRITRGTYKTVKGWLISADVNGAANILKKVAIQLKLSLAEVGRGILTVPKRYDLSCLKKSYRKRYETRLQPVS